MTTYALIFNPHAGHNTATQVAARVAAKLEAAGHAVMQQPTKQAGDATALAFATTADVAVAMGGDGTINEVVAGLVKRKRPPHLGIIPQGTVNNLARVLHIPLAPDAAVASLLHGTAHPLDIGMVNQRVMISTMTLGVLANAAVSVSQRDKQRFGPLIYLVRGLHSLGRNQHWQLRLQSGARVWQRDTGFLLVTMTNSVGGFTSFAPQAKFDDGYLHVFVAPKLTWRRTFLLLPYFLTGNFSRLPGMTYHRFKDVVIDGPKAKLKSRIDGDPSDRLPLHLRVVSDKIRVLIDPQYLD